MRATASPDRFFKIGHDAGMLIPLDVAHDSGMISPTVPI
jgi:hypothetical protein